MTTTSADRLMRKLEKIGTAQNRRVYARHGAGSNQYGVSFKELRALGKEFHGDNQLADELWRKNNQDARILATLIADPKTVRESQLDRWVKQIDYYVLADEFAGALVFKTPYAVKKMEEWTDSDREYIAQCGWVLLTKLAMDDDSLEDEYLGEYVGEIESGIHEAPNRAKYSMNGALIAIGMRDPVLQKVALEAAKRIGTVEVDHGETGCKTPDAAAYMKKRPPARKKKTGAKPSAKAAKATRSTAKRSGSG